jgi:hypothetical protein
MLTHCKQNRAMPRANFVTLNHLYLMKIALIKEISRKRSNTTSIYLPSIMKMTYHIKTAEIVPVFAAR